MNKNKSVPETYRDKVLIYASQKYKTPPEYLWARYPTYAVLRRGDNRKWYGIVMTIPRARIGLNGDGIIDILNIKCDTELYEILRGTPGFVRGYHMGGTWISVLLDGTVPCNQIYALIDNSYELVGKGKLTAIRASQ